MAFDLVFFFKQMTAYEMRISDWSSDVCSSDLRFGFEYEFVSATECYRAGRFDDALKSVLTHYEAIMGVMLPTLREDRRKTYSPILPVCPRTGLVLQVPLTEWNAEAGTVSYYDTEDGQDVTV